RGNNSVWDRSWQTTGSRTTPAIVDAISGQPITTAWNVCRAVGIPPRTRGRSRSALAWRVALLQELQDGTLLLEHLALLLEHLQLLDVDRVERRQRDVIGLGTRVLARRDDVLADDDDREQNELQERLAEPRDADVGVARQEG